MAEDEEMNVSWEERDFKPGTSAPIKKVHRQYTSGTLQIRDTIITEHETTLSATVDTTTTIKTVGDTVSGIATVTKYVNTVTRQVISPEMFELPQGVYMPTTPTSSGARIVEIVEEEESAPPNTALSEQSDVQHESEEIPQSELTPCFRELQRRKLTLF